MHNFPHFRNLPLTLSCFPRHLTTKFPVEFFDTVLAFVFLTPFYLTRTSSMFSCLRLYAFLAENNLRSLVSSDPKNQQAATPSRTPLQNNNFLKQRNLKTQAAAADDHVS